MSGLVRIAATLSALAAVGAPAAAQTVSECNDFRSSAAGIVEPWEENTRTFANGDVRLALIDTVEPAALAFHLLILSPPFDEVGARQCRIFSVADTLGFGAIYLEDLEASYDPAVGLVFDIPVVTFAPDVDGQRPRDLRLTLNQSTGEIEGTLD